MPRERRETPHDTASTLRELQQLRKITENCVAQARMAHSRALDYSQLYKTKSGEFKVLAAAARFPEIRARWVQIAALYEDLAQLAEGIKQQMPVLAADTVSFLAGRAEESMEGRPVEGPLAQARRHVAEAEVRIARQEALVARLSQDRKHAALAAEAKEILDTLKHTLSLARAHLANELRGEASRGPSMPDDAA